MNRLFIPLLLHLSPALDQGFSAAVDHPEFYPERAGQAIAAAILPGIQ